MNAAIQKLSSFPLRLAVVGLISAVLLPTAAGPAHAADRNSGLGPRVCALYPWHGSVMLHLGAGCTWTVSEGRALEPGEKIDLAIDRNPPADVVAAYLGYHDGFMDTMKRSIPSITVEPQAVCSQGAMTGRRMVWHSGAGMTLVSGYARCDGHFLSVHVTLKDGGATSPTALFDLLMARAVRMLARR